ncbi:MAG: M48 family metallopeptidase [Ignavibacteriales bacterium]
MMITFEKFKEEVLSWAERLRIRPKEIHIRNMKNKWASCSSKGRLTFASALLSISEEKRNKVIVHELLHLRYPNHGRMFNVLLDTYLMGNEQNRRNKS